MTYDSKSDLLCTSEQSEFFSLYRRKYEDTDKQPINWKGIVLTVLVFQNVVKRLTKYESIAKVLLKITDQIDIFSSVHWNLCIFCLTDTMYSGIFFLKRDYYLETWICNSFTDEIKLGFADCEIMVKCLIEDEEFEE